jgi:arginine exporter protein ArgO
MFEALISGLIAGWGVAVPLGAIGVMLVDLGMRGGFRSAAPAAAAVATADLLYAAMAAAAGSAVASLLEPHARAMKLIAVALIAGLPAVASAPASAKAVFVVAVGVASLSWQLTLAGSGAALHHRLPEHARLYTALAGNALVLGLAVRMALSA